MPTDESAAAGSSGRRAVLRGLLGGGAAAVLAAQQVSARAATPEPTAPESRLKMPETRTGAESTGQVREFWIQADSFEHNAVSNGYDGMMGRQFGPDQTTFWAVGFRAYTPGWEVPLKADTGVEGIGTNSGIPGPVLRAAVGDTITVHFRNNDAYYQWPHSIHPHGVQYDRDNDGGWLADDPDRPGTAIQYGETYTYTWICRPSSVGTWLYHDHSVPQKIPAPEASSGEVASDGMEADTVMEIGAELGLLGLLVVTDEKTPEVDREFTLLLHDAYTDDVPSLAQDLDMFNGGAFLDNTPTFTAQVGERVRWRIAALGKEFHVFHIHGHRWESRQGYQGWVDSQIIGPSTTLTVEYTEDNPGDWIYHCHVTDHMMGGMVGRYLVRP
ncbi:multicopper oxidase domain-containing protein [Streptomyces sp. So13.3]|uniref:multicopper oxidase domain-containing protein n=2 Tax=Streptomyces TaxID=1883 RepID=UPI0011060AEE|nr:MULTISPECIES: multicopper oxidase domain-containing protein [unclassified Streptomyces]MCZ4103222.1 multicopper oxidase domain-containing protein [Streptomyces sp. H39-C1]QNA70646.1 multicopper oxidase domain-containing protein [Streptomyces sp. So13.3]